MKIGVEQGSRRDGEPEDRHLRRTRRRPRLGEVLPQDRAELRQLLPFRVPIARLAAAQAALEK